MKRVFLFIIAFSMMLLFTIPVSACDEKQSNSYILQILFGKDTLSYENDKNVEKLLSALYLCSEQSNNDGQEKLDLLKKGKVSGMPSLDKINLNGEELFDVSHQSWEYVSKNLKETQELRKNILRKTVTNVFDFGWINELFNRKNGQIDAFASLLYYSHILADYIADDPTNTSVSVKGYDIPSFSGNAYVELKGNVPSFTTDQKKSTDSFKEYSDLDSYGRCGSAISNIGPDTLANITPRNDISGIRPSGWQDGNAKYSEIISTSNLYNRCHLVAHSLGGADTQWNLMTGTRYLNETMEQIFEKKIVQYINQTKNHVLYRVTPVYVGDNKVASGLQLEGYSVEDQGKGISFNVYLYNVQPGVEINYANGKNQLADITLNNNVVPFAVDSPSDSNPDLMYLINKQLEVLFADQKDSIYFKDMMNDLSLITDEARSVGGNRSWEVYVKINKYKYDYINMLSQHIPTLLKKEKFFSEVFYK